MEIIEFCLYAFFIVVVSTTSVPYLLEEKLDMAVNKRAGTGGDVCYRYHEQECA